MGDVLFKIHTSYRTVIAVCDKGLLGKIFEEEARQLDLTGEFFKGEELDNQEIREEMLNWKAEDATFNIVGEKAIELALDAGIIEKSGVMKVGGVPFALVLL